MARNWPIVFLPGATRKHNPRPDTADHDGRLRRVHTPTRHSLLWKTPVVLGHRWPADSGHVWPCIPCIYFVNTPTTGLRQSVEDFYTRGSKPTAGQLHRVDGAVSACLLHVGDSCDGFA